MHPDRNSKPGLIEKDTVAFFCFDRRKHDPDSCQGRRDAEKLMISDRFICPIASSHRSPSFKVHVPALFSLSDIRRVKKRSLC